MEDLRKAFGRRVKALREAGKLSQEALAERGEFHWTYISEIERGKRGPSLDVLGRLATALDVSIAELFAPLRATYRPAFRRSHHLSPARRRTKSSVR